MMYLRSFIFEDAGLMCALLEPHQDPRAVAECVVNHINSRINELDNLTTDDVQQFEEHLESPLNSCASSEFHGTPGIRNSAETIDRTKELWNRLVESWNEATNTNEDIGPIARLMNDALNQRLFATVVRSKVHLRFDRNAHHVHVYYDGKPIILTNDDCIVERQDSRTLPADGDARLDVVLNMGDFSRAGVLTRRGIPVAVIPLWTPESDTIVKQEIIRWYRDQHSLARDEAELQTIFRKAFINSESSAGPTLAKIKDVTLPLWTDVAFRYSRDYSAIDQCAALMSRLGFRGLGCSSTLIRKYALLGLTLSLQIQTQHAREVFAIQGWDLDEALREFSALHAQYGFPPVIADIEATLFNSI